MTNRAEHVFLGAGHYCLRNPEPNAPSYWRCARCGIRDGWDAISCVPGRTVHASPEYLAVGEPGIWEKNGYTVRPMQAEHPASVPCWVCYDPATDPALNPVTAHEIFNAVPAASAAVGGTVAYATAYARVLAVHTWPPGTHRCALSPDFVVRQVVTTQGSAWYGHAPGGTYQDAETLEMNADTGISFEATV